MATFTLEDLKSTVEKKYAPVFIETSDETFELKNLMQLPEKPRNAVIELTEVFDEDDLTLDKQIETFRKILELVEANGKGKALLDLVGDNTALLLEISTLWMENSQVGEAEQS